MLVRSMFDTIAPRYDLVNRMMTFGLDVRWRTQSARALGLPAGSRSARPGLWHRRLPDHPDCRRARSLRHGPVPRDAGGQRHRAARWPRRTVRRCRWPPAAVDGITCGYALRNFTELRGVFDGARPGRPTGGRISLLEVAEPDRGLLLTGHRIWFRHVVPSSAAWCRTPPPTGTCRTRPPTCRATAELRRCYAAAGFSTVNRRALSGGLSQLITATREGRP